MLHHVLQTTAHSMVPLLTGTHNYIMAMPLQYIVIELFFLVEEKETSQNDCMEKDCLYENVILFFSTFPI